MHAWLGFLAHWAYTNLAAFLSWVLDSTSLWLKDLLSTNLFQCILKRCCSYSFGNIYLFLFLIKCWCFCSARSLISVNRELWRIRFPLSSFCVVAHNFYNGIFKSSMVSFFTFPPLMFCVVLTVCFIVYSSFLKIKQLHATFICLILSYYNVEPFKWNFYYSS